MVEPTQTYPDESLLLAFVVVAGSIAQVSVIAAVLIAVAAGAFSYHSQVHELLVY